MNAGTLAGALRERPCYGISCRMARTMDIAPMLRDCGYDWMFLDLEHGPLSMDLLTQMALAGNEAGVTPIVRMADAAPAPINRVLSNGAMGVMVPHVDDPETAEAVARQCRFPPRGERSVPGFVPHLGYHTRSVADAAKLLEPLTLCAVMIESRAAVDAVEEIAAVDGVDILFVGASDLTFDIGKPGAYDDPEMKAAMDRVARAIHTHGKIGGFGGVAKADVARRYVGMGLNLVMAGNDQTLFLHGARARLKALTES